MPAHYGRKVRLCAAGTQEEGEPNRFPLLLRITTPSFRTRCARKRKWRFPVATQAPEKGKQNSSHPGMRRSRFSRRGAQCAPVYGVAIVSLTLFTQLGGKGKMELTPARVSAP